MKINNLKLKNIHSLRGVHEINFASGPLAQTGLFAITGPTGSGKSTLLDAITMALYSHAPRFDKVTNSTIESHGAIITRNTDDAFCEVEYESGSKTYLSRWEISRARTGNLRDYHMSLSIKNESGEYELLDLKRSEIPSKNAKIIGLNYEQFIRSILLSQGEFAKFLKSTPKERSALLEKITGTEIYRRIGKAAFEKQRQEKNRLQLLTERLGDIQLMSEEERAGLKEEMKSTQGKINVVRGHLRESNEKIQVKKEISRRSEEAQKLEKQLDDLRLQRENMKQDADRLELHNALMPLKSDIDRIKSLDERNTRLGREIEHGTLALEKLKIEINGLQEQIKTGNQELETARKDYEELQPVIKKVRTLDREIGLKLAEKKHVEKQLHQNMQEAGQVKETLKEARDEHRNITEKLEKINRFMGENPVLETLVEVLPGVISRKELMDKKTENLLEGLRRAYPEIYREVGAGIDTDDRLAKIKTHHEAIQSEREKHASTFGREVPERSELMEKMDAGEIRNRLLSEMVRLAGQLANFKADAGQSQDKIKELHATIGELEKESLASEKKAEITEKKIEEFQIRKEREALEANYEDARRMLEPDEPCPLCGSVHHPLVESYENKLSITSKELETQKKLQRKLSGELEKIRKEKNRLNAMESGISANLDRLKEDIRKSENEIVSLAAKTGLSKEELKLEVLKPLLEESEQKQRLLREQLTLLDRLEGLQKKAAGLTGFIEKATELNGMEDAINTDLEPFSAYIRDADSMDHAIDILKTKRMHFLEGQKQKAQFREKEVQVSTVVSQKEKQLSELEAGQAEIRKALSKSAEETDKLTVGRKDVFGDKVPDREDKAFVAKLRKMENDLADLRNRFSIKTEKSESKRAQLTRLKSETDDLRREQNLLLAKLQPQLKALGMASFAEASERLLDQQEATGIRTKLEALRTASDKTGQSLEDNAKQIASLKSRNDQDATLAEWQDRATNLESELSELEREIGTANARLKMDEQNREKHAGISRDKLNQEKEFSRWDALNSLIGDREGSKFSKFAQQLTLLQMLAGANQHLKKLTDRYIIINQTSSGDDELFVVDTYHGDEKRSVKTLSGGESFLVSLALALGLSDLAGSKTRINSLFIDEGFGSLDQQTLDIALSTLERLQHETNRTIGVISHVEALKERITTQVELSQDASGKSSLTIRA